MEITESNILKWSSNISIEGLKPIHNIPIFLCDQGKKILIVFNLAFRKTPKESTLVEILVKKGYFDTNCSALEDFFSKGRYRKQNSLVDL